VARLCQQGKLEHKKALYIIVETVIVTPVIAFFDVLKVLDMTGE